MNPSNMITISGSDLLRSLSAEQIRRLNTDPSSLCLGLEFRVRAELTNPEDKRDPQLLLQQWFKDITPLTVEYHVEDKPVSRAEFDKAINDGVKELRQKRNEE